MTDIPGSAMWLVRMALVTLGGALTARGIGDAPLWEAVAGLAVGAVGALMSWRARHAQLAAEPPR